MSLLQYCTLFYYLLLQTFFNLQAVCAYPQQTSTPTSLSPSSVTTGVVLSTVSLEVGGFNLGGLTISGAEQDFTTIALVGISSGTDSNGNSVSQTTYSREIINSDALAFTTTTDGEIIINTLVPGTLYTEIDTIVESASGYYMSGSQFLGGPEEYTTCSFASDGTGGCSYADFFLESTTNGISSDTVSQGQFSGTVVAATVTLVDQAVATGSTTSAGTASAATSGTVSGSNPGAASNGGVSQKINFLGLVYLLTAPVILVFGAI